MTTLAPTTGRLGTPGGGVRQSIDGVWHERSLWLFMVIVIAHWAEHIIQGVQIWVLGMPRAESLGGLGVLAPVLVSSEALHFTFAITMFTGLYLLRGGFSGSSRKWWNASLAIQGWHLVEHTVLLLQVVVGANMFGSPVPTSFLQPFIPRAELHLLYNLLVFAPMVVAMWIHSRPGPDHQDACTCAIPAGGRVEEAPACTI